MLPVASAVVSSREHAAGSTMAMQGGSNAYALASSNSHAWSCLSMIVTAVWWSGPADTDAGMHEVHSPHQQASSYGIKLMENSTEWYVQHWTGMVPERRQRRQTFRVPAGPTCHLPATLARAPKEGWCMAVGSALLSTQWQDVNILQYTCDANLVLRPSTSLACSLAR